MATSNCRWFPVRQDKVPRAFVTADNRLNFSVLTKVSDLATGPLPEAELVLAMDAIFADIVQQGEDLSDAQAIIGQSAFYIGKDRGKNYAFFDTPSGVFVYQEKCGLSAQIPYVVGGAALLGLVGFGVGYKMKGKKGGPAAGLLGAAVGVLAGVGAGYGLAKLATPSYMKNVAGLGAINVQRRRRRLAR